MVAALRATGSPRYDLHVVFSAQSDLGARGAVTGAFGVDPEQAVVVDVAHLDPKETGAAAVGKGPCLGLKELGFLANPETLALVKRAATAARVPTQWLIRESEGSDARAVRAARTGILTALIPTIEPAISTAYARRGGIARRRGPRGIATAAMTAAVSATRAGRIT